LRTITEQADLVHARVKSGDPDWSWLSLTAVNEMLGPLASSQALVTKHNECFALKDPSYMQRRHGAQLKSFLKVALDELTVSSEVLTSEVDSYVRMKAYREKKAGKKAG
jgi:hypothetical protein